MIFAQIRGFHRDRDGGESLVDFEIEIDNFIQVKRLDPIEIVWGYQPLFPPYTICKEEVALRLLSPEKCFVITDFRMDTSLNTISFKSRIIRYLSSVSP